MAKKSELWNLCQKFISEQAITCPETIYQTDRVMENAAELIEEICELIGYAPREAARPL